MAFLSVKDFASRAGVSTQAIYQRLDKDLKQYCKEIKGKKTLDDAALQLFEAREIDKGSKEDLQALETVKMALEALTIQLKEKDKQLERRDQEFAELQRQNAEQQKQISELTEALMGVTDSLKAAQSLHGGTLLQLVSATEQQEPEEIIEATEEQQPEQKRWSFWNLWKR